MNGIGAVRHNVTLDEHGYPVDAVLAWAEHGLYPPPILGDPSNPKVVELHRQYLDQLAQLTPQEQEREHARARECAREFFAALSRLDAGGPERDAQRKSRS